MNNYTVFAIIPGDLKRFSESVTAYSPAQAERLVREKCDNNIFVAAVVEGSIPCVDKRKYADEGFC